MRDVFLEIERNELTFLQQHRSATFDCGFGTAFTSSDANMTTWNFVGALRPGPTGINAAIMTTRELFVDWKRTPCLKVTPMSEPEGWDDALARAGWLPSVRLAHMILERPIASDRGEVLVRRCATENDVKIFSDVQSRGFGVPEWTPWVHKLNLMNWRRQNQRFYLGEIDHAAVGVCLLLKSDRIGGLYAVATLENHRGRGVARTLISTAAADARAMGCEEVCLNTAAGGPAQQAFHQVGFRHAFESTFYTPAAAETC